MIYNKEIPLPTYIDIFQYIFHAERYLIHYKIKKKAVIKYR